jgi:hypothetical protein
VTAPSYIRADGDEAFRGIGRRDFPAWPGWRLIDAAKEIYGTSAVAIGRHFEHDPEMARLVAAHHLDNDGEPTP